MSRRLNEMGLKARLPATKPLISKQNKAARLTYAEKCFMEQLRWGQGAI